MEQEIEIQKDNSKSVVLEENIRFTLDAKDVVDYVKLLQKTFPTTAIKLRGLKSFKRDCN